MSLTAIIVAQEVTDSGDGSLRAGLPLAGKSLFERQAEQAIAVGATKILTLVSTLPQWLTSSIDKLSTQAIQVIPVRSAGEILPHVKETDEVLLIADALHAPAHCYTSILEISAPVLLATPDNQAAIEFERIDGQTRWAGLALLPSSLVSKIGDMPSDWDITSTLLRQAVQAGARRLMCDPLILERGELAIIDDASDASLVTSLMLQKADSVEGGTGHRLVFSPLAKLVGPWSLSRNISTTALFCGATAFATGSLIAAAFGQPLWAAIAAMCGHAVTTLGSYQSIFTGSGKTITRLKSVGLGLSALLPIAILIPYMTYLFEQSGITSLIVLALSLIMLWFVRAPLGRLAGGNVNDADHLLVDAEIFSIALLVASAANIPMAALQACLLAGVTGLLAWVWRMARKTTLNGKNRSKV